MSRHAELSDALRITRARFLARLDPETERVDVDLVLDLIWPDGRRSTWSSGFNYQGMQFPVPVAGLTSEQAFRDQAELMYGDYDNDFFYDAVSLEPPFSDLKIEYEIEPAVTQRLGLAS